MEKIIEKAKSIRLAIFDVDGVLTDGKLHYGPSGIEYKQFNVHDGQGIKYLMQSGVEVGIITACTSTIVAKRMKDLGIQHVYQGIRDKVEAYNDLKQKLNLTDEQIAYTGDDLPDLPLICKVGLGVTVPNGSPILKQHACWITQASGGNGAAREVCDLIMHTQNTYESIINGYLHR
jgi:3-deoxy-D-manno-octulosonate 8-phosphate phosphatase (KDO 8-P phosphatase)